MQKRKTQYNPFAIKKSYDEIADFEDEAEKKGSFRVLIPRYLIKKYITRDDIYDSLGKTVTLVDLTPSVLNRTKTNIVLKGLTDKIQVVEGDITDLVMFQDATFSFVICVGAALSYVLDV